MMKSSSSSRAPCKLVSATGMTLVLWTYTHSKIHQNNHNNNNTPLPFWLKSWPLVTRLEPMASTSSSVSFVQGHTCCPARVARCFRGRTCPYRLRDACGFAHDDDLEEDPPCRDVAATSSLPLRTGTPVFAGLEADSVVTEEIVDFVGQWEKIVDVPVLLRSLDAELQIVEVLMVLPEQIASQLKGWVMTSAFPSA